MASPNIPGKKPFHKVAAGSNDATLLKTGSGTVWEVSGININTTTTCYLKFYDKATAPTPATDTPVYVVPLVSAGSAVGKLDQVVWPEGLKFELGIGYAIVTGIADNDNTGVSAGDAEISGTYS